MLGGLELITCVTHNTDQVGRQFKRWPDWARGRETGTLANRIPILEVEESL